MCNYWKMMLSLAVPAMLAVCIQAAEGPIPEAETVELLVLRQDSVQQHLKIDKKVSTAIRDFTSEQHKKAMQIHKLSESEQGHKYDQLAKENEEFLKKNLNSTQHDRLRQIAMQRAGLLWLANPEVAKKLNLDEKQKEQVKTELHNARSEADKALTVSDSDARHKKMKELHETSREKIKTLLNADQMAKWKEMTGAPFEGEYVHVSDTAEKKN